MVEIPTFCRNFVKKGVMDIQTVKLEIVRLILDSENPGLLNSVRRLFLNSEKADFWDDLSQLQQEEILKGIEEIEHGETVNYQDIISKHR
jgi:hypothetical protein